MSNTGVDISSGYKNDVTLSEWPSSIESYLLQQLRNNFQSCSKNDSAGELLKMTLLNGRNDQQQNGSSSSASLENTSDNGCLNGLNSTAEGKQQEQLERFTSSCLAPNALLSPQQVGSNFISPNGSSVDYGSSTLSASLPATNRQHTSAVVAMPKPIRNFQHNKNIPECSDRLSSISQQPNSSSFMNSQERLRTLLDYAADHQLQNGRNTPEESMDDDSMGTSSLTAVIEDVASAHNIDPQSNGPPSDGTGQRVSRAYFRAPGLEGPNANDNATMTNANVLVCKHCSFSSTSRFHYNSHMNTHTDRPCTMCNYTSRTEGRLRKHMVTSHTAEDRLAAGIELSLVSKPSTSRPRSKKKEPSMCDNDMEASNGVGNSSLLQICGSYATASMDTPVSQIQSTTSTPNLVHYSTPLDQLRALAERSQSVTTPSTLVTNEGHEPLNNSDDEQMAEDSLRGDGQQPARRSGKPKTHKCKQCGHVSKSKDEHWQHARSHIPKEKQLTCNQCMFVTEYKHHLEYHIRNHYNSKPFQCNKCAYTCVNKSMLNSHMKSHVSDYPFRCQDCTYRTKYCHSLKMHLSKYNHRRMPGSAELENDGTEERILLSNESMSNFEHQIDEQSDETMPPNQTDNNMYAVDQNLLNQVLIQHQRTQVPTSAEYSTMVAHQTCKTEPASGALNCPNCNYASHSTEDYIRHLFMHILQNQQQQQQPQNNMQDFQLSFSQLHPNLALQQLVNINPHFIAQQLPYGISNGMSERQETSANIDPSFLLGLSNSDQQKLLDNEKIMNQIQQLQVLGAKEQRELGSLKSNYHHSVELTHTGTSPTESKDSAECGTTNSDSPNSEPQNSRKHSRKVDQISFRLLGKNSPDNNKINMDHEMISVEDKQTNGSAKVYHCQHCDMTFKDRAMYQIHLGFHGFESPFKCNRCGHISKDSLDFNLHLYQAKHD